MALFGYFQDEICKKAIVTIDATSNFLKHQKSLNLGPKLPYLRVLGSNFKKTIVIFEIST